MNEGGHGAWQRRVRRWGVQSQSIAEHEIADVLRALGMRRESDRAYSILLEDSALKDLPTAPPGRPRCVRSPDSRYPCRACLLGYANIMSGR